MAVTVDIFNLFDVYFGIIVRHEYIKHICTSLSAICAAFQLEGICNGYLPANSSGTSLVISLIVFVMIAD